MLRIMSFLNGAFIIIFDYFLKYISFIIIFFSYFILFYLL